MKKGLEIGLEGDSSAAFARLLEHVELRPANQKWYIEILSILDKAGLKQEILAPNYRYVKNSESLRPIMSKEEQLWY